MRINIWMAFLLLFIYQSAFACANDNALQQLTSIESEKLLANAPTFKQAWQDKAINIAFINIKAEGSQCVATLQVTLPQADLNEANQHLDQNPAKRILSAAQGYSVPDNTKIEVPFNYQMIEGKVLPNNPDTPELRALHSNIEYTYQLLAQLRIHVKENSVNQIAWSKTELEDMTKHCLSNSAYQAKYSKSKDSSFCACRSEKLSGVMSPRQMELVSYIETQPFSVATGSMDSFNKLNEKISEACSDK